MAKPRSRSSKSLTEDQREFVRATLGEDFDSEVGSSSRRRSRPKRKFFFQTLKFWNWVIFALTLTALSVFLFFIFRLESILGRSNVEMIARDGLSPEVLTLLSQFGLDWLPTAIQIHVYRGPIVAGIAAVGLLLALILNGTVLLLRSRKASRSSKDEAYEAV